MSVTVFDDGKLARDHASDPLHVGGALLVKDCTTQKLLAIFWEMIAEGLAENNVQY